MAAYTMSSTGLPRHIQSSGHTRLVQFDLHGDQYGARRLADDAHVHSAGVQKQLLATQDC